MTSNIAISPVHTFEQATEARPLPTASPQQQISGSDNCQSFTLPKNSDIGMAILAWRYWHGDIGMATQNNIRFYLTALLEVVAFAPSNS